VDERNYASYFAEEYRAECPNCGANTGTRHQSRFARRNGETFFEKDGYAAAVESWNRRAETGGIAPDPEKAEGG